MNAGTTDLGDERATLSGTIHVAGFVLVLVGALVAYSASGLALRGNQDWRGWRLLGWWPALLFAVSATNLGLPGDLGFIVFVALVWLWYTLVSWRLLAVDRAPAARHEPGLLPDAAAPGLL
jgi:hypothetical protein